MYVRETFAFLLRGHSLFEPGCCCAPPVWWNACRTATLGLTRKRRCCCATAAAVAITTAAAVEAGRQTGKRRKRKRAKVVVQPPPLREEKTICDVRCDHRGSTRSVQEIALELGILHGLNGHVEVCLGDNKAHFAPLLDVLVRLAGLVPDGIDPQTGAVLRLGSPLCCVPRLIRNGQDIEQAARALAPRRPYIYCPAEDAVVRRIIDTDLRVLVEQRRVRMLPSSIEGAWAIFWNGDALHLEPTESPSMLTDMRTRWNSAAAVMPPRRQ